MSAISVEQKKERSDTCHSSGTVSKLLILLAGSQETQVY